MSCTLMRYTPVVHYCHCGPVVLHCFYTVEMRADYRGEGGRGGHDNVEGMSSLHRSAGVGAPVHSNLYEV
jgi:hypothetical protein